MADQQDDAKQGQQLNRALGQNTVQFHLDGKMPNPQVVDIDKGGGTPNQKTERWANRIAFYHFVQPNAAKAEQALQGTLAHFQGMVDKGHQCVGDTDEALTLSHGPIWWRAILSLRITSQRLAAEKGGRFKDLEQAVLDWLEFHTTLNLLGEIQSGPRRGEVWLPGARSKESDQPETDKVTNVIHQLLTTGNVISKVGPKFFKLSQDAQDIAGAALVRLIQGGIGVGNVKGGRLPKLANRLVVERFDDGHAGRYPDGIKKDNGHVQEAWAHYPSGRIGLSKTIGHIPADVRFTGQAKQREVARA